MQASTNTLRPRFPAAKQALMRKKQHEHSLNQTSAQIATIEQEVYSIEAANINQETLKAMEKAGKAMSQIHGGLTIDKVDETMFVPALVLSTSSFDYTDETIFKGQTSRTARPRPGNRPSHHLLPHRRHRRPRRPRAGTRRDGTRSSRRADDRHGHSPRH